MRDWTNEWLRFHFKTKDVAGYTLTELRPAAVCVDGFKISIQASEYHYCNPRGNLYDFYDKVELGFPNKRELDLADYAKEPEHLTKTVYGYVPIDVINAVIEKHGGLKGL